MAMGVLNRSRRKIRPRMEHRPHIYDASTRARFALTYRLVQTMMP